MNHVPRAVHHPLANRSVLSTPSQMRRRDARMFPDAAGLVEPEFWTPKWTPGPAKRPKSVQRYDQSFRNYWVGHPGLVCAVNSCGRSGRQSMELHEFSRSTEARTAEYTFLVRVPNERA